MTGDMPQAEPVKERPGDWLVDGGQETVIPGTDWVVWTDDRAYIRIMNDGAVEITGSAIVYVRKLGMLAP